MPIEVMPAFRALGIALALGLLVGIQRQRSQSLVAGVRTFALVTLLGACCAIMATAGNGPPTPPETHPVASEPHAPDEGDTSPDAGTVGSNPEQPDRPANSPTDSPAHTEQANAIEPADSRDPHQPPPGPVPTSWTALGPGAWILAAGALAVVALAVLGNLIALHKGEGDSGMSTEVAMILMYAVGALAWLAPVQVPAAVGVATAILLHAKDALHRFTDRIGEKDVRAVLTFALITFIILPVVPNQTFGPFDVLNPRETWRMVVLVVGISLAGYIATKLIGRSHGALVSGLMGGLVSSTATTAAAARQTRPDGGEESAASSGRDSGLPRAASPGAHLANLAATIIMLATVVMYGRVLVEVAVVARDDFAAIAPPIAILLGVTLALAVLAWLGSRKNGAEIPEPKNPAQLRPAIVFALLYAAVLFIAAAAQHYLGTSGLLAVSAISGLTDMDAITLSSARLVSDGRLEPREAVSAILIGATANMVFKAGMIATLGSRALLRRVAIMYGVCAVVAIGLALLWPSAA